MTNSFVATDPHTHNGENTWFTPKFIFENLGVFDMDVATTIYRPFDTALKHLEVEKVDSLKTKWSGCVWMNPPYGQEIGPFISKFLDHANGVCLVYSRTGTPWMQSILRNKLIFNNIKILFLRQRIRFISKDGSASSNAGADSCLIGMGKGINYLRDCYLQGVLI